MYLSCPHCRLTLSESAARSALQYCPRCLLRHSVKRTMAPSAGPARRFSRSATDVARIAEAKSRVTGRLPATG